MVKTPYISQHNSKGAGSMDKTVTIKVAVNPILKGLAGAVLEELGIPMATAINMYLRQIIYMRNIPFPVLLPYNPSTSERDMQ